MADSHAREQRAAANLKPTLNRPILQVLYKPTRFARFESPEVIDFIVNGEVGLHLSDALEGNWEGLKGRDDKHFFGGNQSQIIIRLQVGLSASA